MTPDSPKGPENQEAPLRERISRAIQDEAAVWEEQFNAGPGIVCSVSDASVVAARLVESELERLTAEVAGLRGLLNGWDRYARRTMRQKREWRRCVSEAEAEVSRLREQLAAQQPVWAPADPTDESARLAEALRFVGVVDPDDDCMSVFDTTGEGIKHWVPVESIALRLLEYTAGVSSSEVEAPQPLQHSTSTWELDGVWHGLCVTFECGERVKGCQAAVEYWKDQHEADTLRPTLATGGLVEAGTLDLRDESGPPGFVVPQRSEGRPSGSGRLAPRTMGVCMECRCALPIHKTWCTHIDGPEDAAQAARSEATPEVPSAHARVWTRENAEEPKPAVGDNFPNLVDAHGVRWVADERDDGFEGWRSDSHGFRIWRSWAQLLWQRGPLTEVPSPSLRKEGEDSGTSDDH